MTGGIDYAQQFRKVLMKATQGVAFVNGKRKME